MNHNTLPAISELTSEPLQYADGEVTIGYRTSGDTINLNSPDAPPYAQHLITGADMVLIGTDENTYGVGRGFVVDLGRSKGETTVGQRIPTDVPPVVIGEHWTLPGAKGIVKQVQIRHMVTNNPNNPFPGVEHIRNEPSPFVGIDGHLSKLANKFGSRPPEDRI